LDIGPGFLDWTWILGFSGIQWILDLDVWIFWILWILDLGCLDLLDSVDIEKKKVD
jgi:hypothetical protein